MAFDQQVFLLQKYGGISRYFCNLQKEFFLKTHLDTRIFAPIHFNENLAALGDFCKSGYVLPDLPPKMRRLATEISIVYARFLMKKFSPDIIHETYFSLSDFKARKSKIVLTVYDFIHERYSEMFDQAHKTSDPKKVAALRADHVICISESTRRDLIEYCSVPEERISVTYLGADVCFRRQNIIPASSLGDQPPFVLFVGSRSGYKNFDGFVRAFASSDRLVKDFDIVCFGGGALTVAERNMSENVGLRVDQIRHYGGSDDILAKLYYHASALIYPSLYEGFGIPPLEAMAAGCPVVSSDTSSLPEVVGGAGEYFDPTEDEAIRVAMENVLYSNERCLDLVQRGYSQEAKFSWAKCADETLAIYRSLL
ncbi:glycosyltransferase family 4 protein [Thalassospira marina]|uniref:glycosyltransferase family 4 protein n=1 Tax=Thalassospira marina TaxID=2048283 RepID=UPI001FEA439E|nr:glycosyltransferase family 1 protein [Thalassospira marina]